MGVDSKIEWTDSTWNPWQGCTKVSPACTNCYMFRDLARWGKDGSIVVRSADQTFYLPRRMKRDKTPAIPSGHKVFTCSLSDWFHETADPWRPEAWEMVRDRSDLIFQIVTKRTERIMDHLPDDWGDHGYSNVWLIATAETQEWAETRWAHLEQIPAAVRGLSCEPLLGSIYFDDVCRHGILPDWIVVGGESGPKSREMELEDARLIRNWCTRNKVAFYFKQWGEKLIESQLPKTDESRLGKNGLSPQRHVTVGKARAGRELDGREWSEFPTKN